MPTAFLFKSIYWQKYNPMKTRKELIDMYVRVLLIDILLQELKKRLLKSLEQNPLMPNT